MLLAVMAVQSFQQALGSGSTDVVADSDIVGSGVLAVLLLHSDLFCTVTR